MKQFLILVLITFSVLLHGQKNANLSIVVFADSINAPVANATVMIPKFKILRTTDKEGKCFLENLPIGQLGISISFVGFATVQKTIELKDGNNYLEFFLQSEVIPIDEITVTATRGIDRETPVTFSNLSGKEIGYISNSSDITSALTTLPSVSYHSENGNGLGYTYIRLRGFDQRRISVLINGIPQNDPEEHSVYWINFFDLAGSLQDAQIQRGAGAAFYGPPSIGGSINLVTKTGGDNPSLTLETGVGSFNTRRFSLSLGSGILFNNFRLFSRLSRVTSDGYRDWSWSKFWKYFLSATYSDQRQSLNINFHGGPQKDGLAFYGIPKSYNSDPVLRKFNFGIVNRDKEYLNSVQFSLIHDYLLSEKINLHNTFFYTSGDGYFDFDGSWGTHDYFRLDTSFSIPLNTVIRAYVNNDQFGWLPRMELSYNNGKMITGFEIRNHSSLHWGRIESGDGLPLTGEKAQNFYEYRGKKSIYSVYLNNLISFYNQLLLLSDVQIIYQQYRFFGEKYRNHDFTTPYLFVNPKLGLNFNINEFSNLYLSAALTYREPPLKNLYDGESASWGVDPQFNKNPDGTYDYSDPLVKPERLLNFELGQRITASNFRLNANLYWMEFHNEIVPSGGLDVYGQPRVGNAERTRHIGLEIEGVFRLLTGLDIRANLNLSRNRFINFIEYSPAGESLDRKGNYIANAPELIINSSLVYSYSDYLLALYFKYNGKHYTDNSQNPSNTNEDAVTVDPFSVFDLRAGYSFNVFALNINILGEVINIFDIKYLMTGFGLDNFFPAAGRAYYLTVKLNL